MSCGRLCHAYIPEYIKDLTTRSVLVDLLLLVSCYCCWFVGIVEGLLVLLRVWVAVLVASLFF
jgi:hypothetical protein